MHLAKPFSLLVLAAKCLNWGLRIALFLCFLYLVTLQIYCVSIPSSEKACSSTLSTGLETNTVPGLFGSR